MKLKCILTDGKEFIINTKIFHMERKGRKLVLFYRGKKGEMIESPTIIACFVEQVETTYKSVFVGDNNSKFTGK